MNEYFSSSLIQKYSTRFQEYGATPKGSFWVSKTRQELRFEIILREVKKISRGNPIEIADIGCGYGALANYLSLRNDINLLSYEGYDISPKLITECNKRISFGWARFQEGFKPRKTMPFSIMSGTYNLAATKDVFSWENYIFECLKKCWSKTSKAMVFNLQISKRAKISESNIYFAEKNKIIETCVALFGPTRVIFDKDLPNDATFSVINRNLVSS